MARPGSGDLHRPELCRPRGRNGLPAAEIADLFFKHPNTVVGPFDEVLIPRGSTRTDWEVELAVVIGSRCRYLDDVDDASNYIAGFTISNDVSEREFQIDLSGGQWSKGKSCETFNPLGPWLVPTNEVADPQKLSLRSFVNGEARQDSTTADMIFSVNYLVWHLSQFLVLDPGDIVNTGTPQGVALSGRFPYLSPGRHHVARDRRTRSAGAAAGGRRACELDRRGVTDQLSRP